MKIEREGNFLYELMENPKPFSTAPFVNKWWAAINKQQGFNIEDKEIEKVSCLFQAAPEMLELLEMLVNQNCIIDSANHEQALRIIKKAKDE